MHINLPSFSIGGLNSQYHLNTSNCNDKRDRNVAKDTRDGGPYMFSPPDAVGRWDQHHLRALVFNFRKFFSFFLFTFFSKVFRFHATSRKSLAGKENKVFVNFFSRCFNSSRADILSHSLSTDLWNARVGENCSATVFFFQLTQMYSGPQLCHRTISESDNVYPRTASGRLRCANNLIASRLGFTM